jgi:hypothetical protein
MQQAKDNQRVSLIVRRYLYPNNNNNNQLTSKENKKNIKIHCFFFYVSCRSI